jgi:peptide/nickel transport system permease protein
MSADSTAPLITEASPAGVAVIRQPRARRMNRTWRSVLCWTIPLVLYLLIALIGPAVIAYDPVSVQIGQRLKPPGTVLENGSRAWLGTDQVGRDMLAQIVRGARVSLLIGLATVVVAGIAGSLLGLVAGYFGKGLDNVIMRLADIQLAFPSILLAILIASVLGPSIANVIITLAFTRWVVFARIARATTLVTKEREFVTATRASGAGTARIVLRHLAPALVAPFLVIATVEMGLVIIAEASLSFLGLGTNPSQPSWGLVIANGRDYLNTAWWIATLPGVALCLVVLGVGIFGDRLRDALDPRLSRRA